ncbi:MAG: hypothetical protein IKG27_00050 [Bacilli bacterium]|nr:hypothetical protein [Bacilli bacterium]
MKKYLKEIIIVFVQIIAFYVLPLYPKEYPIIGLRVLTISITFILSVIVGLVIKKKIGVFYPILVAILFIPSVLMYFNETVLIYAEWYFITSATGLIIGAIIKEIYEARRNDKLHK